MWSPSTGPCLCSPEKSIKEESVWIILIGCTGELRLSSGGSSLTVHTLEVLFKVSASLDVILFSSDSWKPGEWSVCSRSCAGGQQSRKVQCVQKKPFQKEEAVLHSLCPVSTPTQVQACNSHACPPEWSLGPWSQVTWKGLGSAGSFTLQKEGDKNRGGWSSHHDLEG